MILSQRKQNIKRYRNNIVIFIIFVTLLQGCEKGMHENRQSNENHEFVPATGWVLVKNGDINDVKKAIISYDGIAREIKPKRFKVVLHSQNNGKVAVLFPDGLPAYDLANLTGWLNAPPEQPSVYDAVSWLTSPKTKIKYYFKPEIENEWGDTLVGSSTDGASVRVFLPETGLSLISRKINYVKEPEIFLNKKPEIIYITLDSDTAFGNQEFLLNKPMNYKWKP